jgi:hypothetical protein
MCKNMSKPVHNGCQDCEQKSLPNKLSSIQPRNLSLNVSRFLSWDSTDLHCNHCCTHTKFVKTTKKITLEFIPCTTRCVACREIKCKNQSRSTTLVPTCKALGLPQAYTNMIDWWIHVYKFSWKCWLASSNLGAGPELVMISGPDSYMQYDQWLILQIENHKQYD